MSGRAIRTMLGGIVIATVGGNLLGVFILWVAFQHNPQGEFFDQQTGQLELFHIATLFIASALWGILTLATAEIVLWVVGHLLGKALRSFRGDARAATPPS